MPSRSARLISRLAVLTCLIPLPTACAGPPTSVQLPGKPAPTPTSLASKPRPLSSRQQVIAAYTGYTSAIAAAFDSRSTARVRQLLQRYLDTAAINSAVRAFRKAWAKDEISYGHSVLHILSVRIRGNAAWVHDCDDTSKTGLKSSRTGQAVPGSPGIPDSNLVTRLNRVHGQWQVYIQTVEDVPCKA